MHTVRFNNRNPNKLNAQALIKKQNNISSHLLSISSCSPRRWLETKQKGKVEIKIKCLTEVLWSCADAEIQSPGAVVADGSAALQQLAAAARLSLSSLPASSARHWTLLRPPAPPEAPALTAG